MTDSNTVVTTEIDNVRKAIMKVLAPWKRATHPQVVEALQPLRDALHDLSRIEEQLEALREIEQLARELIELDAWAFIGWEPSGERKEAIENTFASLTEKLTGLDVKASNPASEPKGAVGSTGHWWDGHDGVFRTGTPGTVRTEQNQEGEERP